MSDFSLRKAQDHAAASALPLAPSPIAAQVFGAKPATLVKQPPIMQKHALPPALTAELPARMMARPAVPAIKPQPPPFLPLPRPPVMIVPLIKGAGQRPMHHTVKANNGSPGGGSSGRQGAISWQRDGGQNSGQFQQGAGLRRNAKPSRLPAEKKIKPRKNVDRLVRVLQRSVLRQKVELLFRNMKKDMRKKRRHHAIVQKIGSTA